MRIERPFAAFAAMLREAREARRMTQAQLAERLELGQQAVSNWERGKSRPQSIAEVGALAKVFPEHPLDDWLKASGYADTPPHQTDGPRGTAAPVRPLVDLLPLGSLGPEQFEEFCAAFVQARFEGAEVNRVGIAGDTQGGVDIIAHFPDGRRFAFQCKRVREFGPEKVRAVVSSNTTGCDQAFLLLSREATAAARNALLQRSKGTTWVLWDGRDIARQIRYSLSASKKQILIDSFFPKYRKDFLGTDDPSPFESRTQYFAPLLRRDIPFSHIWKLVGRDQELRLVQRNLERATNEITIVVGPGGSGKTRLIRAAVDAFAQLRPTCDVLFLPSHRQPTARALDQISRQETLLIIEDAHERSDLQALFHATAGFATRPKILLTTRPYGLQMVRGDAMGEGYTVSEETIIELQGLSKERATEIAKEILGAKNGPIEAAQVIAGVTHGSPFALVVGSYLVATHRIHPSALNNISEFRAQLMARFRDTLTGDIAPTGEEDLLRRTLGLTALIRPIDPDAPSFAAVATQLIEQPLERIRRALQLLYEAGVLVKRGRLYHIVPDLLADYLLEQSCLPRGPLGSLGFAERALEWADADSVTRILVNVSALDWRLSAADRAPSQVVDAVWRRVEALFLAEQGNHEALLEGVATAAYYQPAQALAFYDKVHHSDPSGEKLARLLRNAALHIDHVREACSRLWELGKNDSRELNQYPNHPVRLLKELAAIEPRKPIEYCEAIVEFAIRGLGTQDALSSKYTLFEVLDMALAPEGSTTESRGRDLVIQRFAVRRGAVSSLRGRVIDFLLQTIRQDSVLKGARAIACLSHALRYPMNIDEAARKDWDREFCDTLDKLRKVVKSSELEPVLYVEIARALSWHIGFGGEPTASRAGAVINDIPQTLEVRTTFALADGWGQLKRRRMEDLHQSMDEWRSEQMKVARDLVSATVEGPTLTDFLRERLRAFQTARSRAAPAILVGLLTECRPKLASMICELVLHDPTDALRDVFPQALYQLSMVDPARALGLADQTLGLGDPVLRKAVGWTYGMRLRCGQSVTPKECTFVERLLLLGDDDTVGHALLGVGNYASTNRAWAVATLLAAPFDRSEHIAGEVFAALARPGSIELKSLDRVTIAAFLEKLTNCPSLSDFWVQSFLKEAAIRLPGEVIRLLLNRITKDIGESNWRFEPLPHPANDQTRLDFRSGQELSHHLQAIREWLMRTPGATAALSGIRLYALVAGDFDHVVLADLDPWIKSGDPKKLEIVGQILSEAPRSFVFDQRAFIVELLDRAEAVGKECVERLLSYLRTSSLSGVRRGSPGLPFAQDVDTRDRAAQTLTQVPRASPAWSFYSGLQEGAESNIRRKRTMDEELFEE